MAKVRVYELARELDMDSKQLVEKLVGGGMSIKNYMSTLDEAGVVRAKEIASGAVSEVIEERRIKPTVIRRRKKIRRVKPEIPSAKVEEKDKVEILRPETPPKEEELPEAAMSDAEVAKEAEVEPAIEMGPTDEAALAEEPQREEKATALQEVAKEPPPTEKIEPEAPAGKVIKPVAKPKVEPRKPKKRKADQPAKIIRRAEEGPLRAILAKRSEEKPTKPTAKRPIPFRPPRRPEVAQEVPKIEVPEPSVKKKKEKKKAQQKELVERSALRRRKKEVYEKADLYEGRAFRRKEKVPVKKAKEAVKEIRQTEITVPKAIKRRIKVQESVTAFELARAMGTKAGELIKQLMKLGVAANINQSLDFDTASLVADEFGYELELAAFQEARLIEETADRPEDLEPRPPVVTIMGHVDHGKTSLLDYIRKSNIIGGESGGITQHIGAYYVNTEAGDIVFLDTPGHEAFTAMRARGAKVTDLIVLVVAADDGVMPQTREAINHARAASIPIVVAINKIDKPEANPEKVKRELAQLELTPEDWGGETLFGSISAKTGDGVEELLSVILLQAEMLELKGNPRKAARGVIIEAKLDKSKGPVATVLIKNGTLHKGDYFICGEHYGRVRAMLDHRGKKMKSAGPAMPVEIYGISGVPMAGDEFISVEDERTAKQVIEHRKEKTKKQEVARRGLVSLDDLFERIK
jgi:translation initiation factor IF-2